MPFTLSHPVATLPFARRGLVLSALVVGSMAPDFGYFLPLLSSGYSHTLPGTVFVCIPAGLVALWIFHRLLKYPLLSLLPENHQKRLLPVAKDFAFKPTRKFILIIISLWVGALTHILWDAFTHFNGWAVERFPLLRVSVFTLSQHTLKVYKVLQHSSTFMGMVLLCCCYIVWYKRTAPQQALLAYPFLWAQQKLIFGLGAIAAILALGYGAMYTPLPLTFDALRAFVFRSTVTGMTILSIEFFVFSLMWHLKS